MRAAAASCMLMLSENIPPAMLLPVDRQNIRPSYQSALLRAPHAPWCDPLAVLRRAVTHQHRSEARHTGTTPMTRLVRPALVLPHPANGGCPRAPAHARYGTCLVPRLVPSGPARTYWFARLHPDPRNYILLHFQCSMAVVQAATPRLLQVVVARANVAQLPRVARPRALGHVTVGSTFPHTLDRAAEALAHPYRPLHSSAP